MKILTYKDFGTSDELELWQKANPNIEIIKFENYTYKNHHKSSGAWDKESGVRDATVTRIYYYTDK